MNVNTSATETSILAIIRQSGYGPMLSTREVAEFLGLSQGAIHKALVARRLLGLRIGSPRGRWRVPAVELARFVCGRAA
ncbi:MAG: helix-turn-helix domain-containing protein [Planctomycetes bacterium]|nr:helix-turn-helix domain-containing protein [Planctomycetota bacterium]